MIDVDPRAAARIALLADPPVPASRARTRLMRSGEALSGPHAGGREGDFVLENAEVIFVVGAVTASDDESGRAGALLDAADAYRRQDELERMTPNVGDFSRRVIYRGITRGTSADGSAWVEATGTEGGDASIAVKTRYTLHGPDRALLVETTVESTADPEPAVLVSFGDDVDWGSAKDIVAPGTRKGPYVGAVGRFVSYALTSTEGIIEASSEARRTHTVQARGVKLERGRPATYARVFVVGSRPDTSSLVAELTLSAGQPVGEFAVHVPPALVGDDGLLRLETEGGGGVLTLAAPFAGTLPVGRYWVVPAAGGRLGPLDVTAAEGKAEIAVPP